MRNEVVLPQPDGPRSEKNSPRSIAMSTPSTATKSPKRFSTSTSSMTPSPMISANLPLPRTGSRLLPMGSHRRNVTGRNLATIDEFWDLLYAKDWDALAALFAPDAEYTDVPTPADDLAHGPDQ